MIEKVWLVGDCGPEHDRVVSVHRTYAGALKAFQEHRIGLLNQAKDHLAWAEEQRLKEPAATAEKEEGRSWLDSMWQEMVERLSEEDPEKIDNFPHETPYIREMEVLE